MGKSYEPDHRLLIRSQTRSEKALQASPGLCDELLDMLHDEVRIQGRVPDAYDPHILDNPRAAYSGALEFHFMDDVLVICYPPTPREFLRILHICTHAELKAGRCSDEWPRG